LDDGEQRCCEAGGCGHRSEERVSG
jgi:hypothetical protein